jgi:hypothetical protein
MQGRDTGLLLPLVAFESRLDAQRLLKEPGNAQSSNTDSLCWVLSMPPTGG